MYIYIFFNNHFCFTYPGLVTILNDKSKYDTILLSLGFQ